MPTYEYACRACGEHIEVVQSFKDEPLRECPACSGELRKVFSPIGITFKGSGFYRTDSRSLSGPGRSRPKEAGAEPAPGAGGKGEGKASSGSGDTSPGSSNGKSPGSSNGKSSAAAS